MQRGLIISVLLHTLVVLAFAIGLPALNQPKAHHVAEIPVDIANISDITNPPKGSTKSKSTKAKKAKKALTPKAEKPKPPKPKPPKPKVVEKAPPPAKKQVATLVQPKPPEKKTPPKKVEPKKVEPKKAEPKKAAPPKPKITSRPTLRPKREVRKAALPKPKKKPEKKEPKKKAAAPKNDAPKKKAEKPKPKPKKVAKKAKPKPKRIASKPEKKPKKPARKVAKKPKPKATPKKPTRQVAARKPKRKSRMDDIYSFLKKNKGKDRTHQRAQRRTERRGARTHRANLPLSISERMAIARQIKPCWRFPLGAKDERSLRVEIRVWMGRDGRPVRHQILDRGRYGRDPFFRAAADAGIRAIYNPRCLPIRLPAGKYNTWRVMILDFDPAKVSEGSL